MSGLVVLDVDSPPAKLRGHLQRFMLEIRPGTFVWKLPSKKVREVWKLVEDSGCSAICVFQSRNESGFIIATSGKGRRTVVDNFGIQLIAYQKDQKSLAKIPD